MFGLVSKKDENDWVKKSMDYEVDGGPAHVAQWLTHLNIMYTGA